MNKKLEVLNNNQNTIDSREVAEMMGKKHWEVLRMLEGKEASGKKQKSCRNNTHFYSPQRCCQ